MSKHTAFLPISIFHFSSLENTSVFTKNLEHIQLRKMEFPVCTFRFSHRLQSQFVWSVISINGSVLQHKLMVRWDTSGIWEGFVEGLTDETLYKYQILTYTNQVFEKSDPYARHCETPPATASIILG